MVAVHKKVCATWAEALALAQKKLALGYCNVRVTTAWSKTAKKYGLQAGQALLKWW